jgi:CHAT domain-containing protein
LFELSGIIKAVEPFRKFIDEAIKDFNEETLVWTETLEEKINQLQEVANKFQSQLQLLLDEKLMPEQNEHLQKRLIAASKYFAEQLQNIYQYLLSSVAVTDSKQKAMVYNMLLQDVHVAIAQKIYAMKGP